MITSVELTTNDFSFFSEHPDSGGERKIITSYILLTHFSLFTLGLQAQLHEMRFAVSFEKKKNMTLVTQENSRDMPGQDNDSKDIQMFNDFLKQTGTSEFNEYKRGLELSAKVIRI